MFRKAITRVASPSRRMLSVVVDNGESKNEAFVLMQDLRASDRFHEGITQEEMVKLFFPNTPSAMALSLSNVTSAFYGVMLNNVAKSEGTQKINALSQSFFYDLGRTKSMLTQAELNGKFDLPKDSRGVVIMLISAIYNASPEYHFQIKKFSEDESVIELTGVDRYLRMTKKLEIDQHLQWPVLHRFMEGINDEIGANVDVTSEMLKGEDTGECHERFTMKRR